MMLAQLPAPEASMWWAFSLCVVALMGILLSVKALQRKPPLEAEFATKEEVKENAERAAEAVQQLRGEINERLTGLSAKVTALRTEIHDERREDKKDAEARVASIHLRITEVRQDMIAMRESQTADAKAILDRLGQLQARGQS